MISGVSASSYSYAPRSTPPVQAARSTASVAGTENDFAIPESALRTERAQQTADTSATPGVAGSDPSAASEELARMYPQLLVGQSYPPPPVQDPQQVAALAEESTSRATMERRGDDATGAETERAVEEGSGVPGEDEESEGTENTGTPEETKANGQAMTEQELNQVRELSNRDREVRAHEQAHQAVGGQYSGGMSFEYQQGPDGNRYAVGGEVSIDISAERDPEATIRKMQQVKSAAMAPAEPSGQDRSVAASATATEMEARKELAQQNADGATEQGQTEETGEGGNETEKSVGTDALDPTRVNGSQSGGVANLSSNPYIQRYQNQDVSSFSGMSGMGQAIPTASENRYRSIDVVA